MGPVTCVDAGAAGCWRMGEAAGTTMLDSSGNGNHGTYLNGVLLGQLGLFGDDTAARFDGVNDHARVPDSATLDVGDSFTAEGWIQRSSATKAHQLFNKGDKGLHLVVLAGTGQVLLRKANITTIAQTTGGVPSDGQFHHVAATMDGAGSARIYIDGVEQTQQVSAVHTIADTALPLTIGGTGTNPATLDEFALYDTALTAEQIAARLPPTVEELHTGPGDDLRPAGLRSSPPWPTA